MRGRSPFGTSKSTATFREPSDALWSRTPATCPTVTPAIMTGSPLVRPLTRSNSAVTVSAPTNERPDNHTAPPATIASAARTSRPTLTS